MNDVTTSLEFRLGRPYYNRPWESIPVEFEMRTIYGTTHTINPLGTAIAEHLSRVFECEIRWNIKGISQGHYVEVRVRREDS